MAGCCISSTVERLVSCSTLTMPARCRRPSVPGRSPSLSTRTNRERVSGADFYFGSPTGGACRPDEVADLMHQAVLGQPADRVARLAGIGKLASDLLDAPRPGRGIVEHQPEDGVVGVALGFAGVVQRLAWRTLVGHGRLYLLCLPERRLEPSLGLLWLRTPGRLRLRGLRAQGVVAALVVGAATACPE